MLRRCRPLLGTFVEVAADCEEAIEAAFAAVSRVHRLMSAHDEESDLARINRFAHRRPVMVDPWTAAVLERASFWATESHGAFDTVRAGHAALIQGRLPRHRDQPLPVAADQAALTIDGNEVRLAEPASVDLGGIAKGFAVDVALTALRARGTPFGLVDAGGDMAGFGRTWPVEIRNPLTREAHAEVLLQDRAIATSAIVEGSLDHLYNCADGLISATVLAPAAIDADALTKVVLSRSPCAARCLDAAKAQAFLIRRDGTLKPIALEAA